MGIYLNPGNDMFAETVRGEIYVDKTGLIEQINAMVRTPQKFICPNTEIRGEYRNAITGDHWKDIATALETSDPLLRATWEKDA